MATRPIFPFTAIVAQDLLRLSLILNSIDLRLGGVLIRGERGTAKSTAARALAALLPELRVIADSPYNDDPDRPDSWSDYARERYSDLDPREIPVTTRRAPFVDMPVSASEDRVLGSLSLEEAIQKGVKVFEPGLLAAVNRGVLYIDEVNLLDDHIVDLLLDSAAMGVNIVQREGISFSHSSLYVLISTMNPEEGDLRPQLLDRFALSVNVEGIHDAARRIEVIERHIAFESDPEGFQAEWEANEKSLSDRIAHARDLLPNVSYTRNDLRLIASQMSEMQVDGHRADLVVLKAARAHAAYEGRNHITIADIALAIKLAIPHRLKRGPFADATAKLDKLQENLQQKQDQMSDDGEAGDSDEMGEPQQGQSTSKKKPTR